MFLVPVKSLTNPFDELKTGQSNTVRDYIETIQAFTYDNYFTRTKVSLCNAGVVKIFAPTQ